MPQFNDIRKELNRALNDKERARQDLTLNKEQLLSVQRRKEKLTRRFNPRNPESVSEKRKLEQHEQTLVREIKRNQSVLEEQSVFASDLLGQYEVVSDPREAVQNLNDDTPFLLMPVRIETRFKELKDGDESYYQLWVRVYPDDVAIDTFEENLSRSEVSSAKLYYQGIWQAAGREGMERAAWRDLVAAYGSGRARYILENYAPVNADDFPEGASNTDLILTIPVNESPPPGEADPIKTFWLEVWQAGSDQAKRKEARDRLASKVGEERASQIMEQFVPSNLNPQAPSTDTDVEVTVVFIQFPKEEELKIKEQSWSQAAKTYVMPDRFVVTGYTDKEPTSENIAFQEIGKVIPSPLIMGPDPSLDKEEQLQQADGELKVNEELKWMVDFDEAVKNGMGFRIPLTNEQGGRGFDRIVVLGLKLSAGKDEAASYLETLFHNHQRSKKGLTLLPQGTPTNNTEESDSGYIWFEDPDVSFDQMKSGEQFTQTTDWLEKKDGQWLAEWLGVNPEVFKHTYNASLTDQMEARAMNIALFPGTIGYMMESLMQEVFTDEEVEMTRWYFNHFVSGRGPVPAIKIGRQPYGILPVTVFSEMKWISRDNFPRAEGIEWIKGLEFFMPKLYEVLKQIDRDWSPLLNQVAWVGKNGDAHQLLLDIVGLSPNSVEYYQRYAEDMEALINRFKLAGGLGVLIALILAGNYEKSGRELLESFGVSLEQSPEILKKFFLQSENKLYRYLVDEAKLSETEPVRPTTTDGKNYLEWLVQAANTSHDALRAQAGFIDNNRPSALLYLMLKHSLDLGYINTSLFLNLKANLLSTGDYKAAKKEPKYIHVQQDAKVSESRWKPLYEAQLQITGNSDQLIGEYIPQVLNTELKSSYLKKQLDAVSLLEKTPTARLERVLTEHIDLGTYRLDAWKNGLMNYELATMRFGRDSNNQVTAKPGTFLGAYGWLEDVRPENKKLKPINLEDEELAKHFNQPGEPQLMTNDQNGGFIAAPSLNHAVTAAILRNAYMSDDSPEVYEINLSSERVRKALSLVEGIRAGQSLSALLGYYLERELHDQNAGLEQIDYHIFKLRKAFPLRADKNETTQSEDDDPIEAIEARNVVDGLALINQVKSSGEKEYPFGKANILPEVGTDAPSEAIKKAINKEVENIINLNDAIADVAMAESVHQVVLGNFDRAAATMDAFSKGNFPPMPEVVRTPRSGTMLTQRFGLQFESGVDPAVSPNSMPVTPRSKAEPAINKWLADILPTEEDVAVEVLFYDYTSHTEKTEILTQKLLQLQPLDMLYVVNTDDRQAMTALDDRIEQTVRKTFALRPDADVNINYTVRIADKISFFELSAQMHSLRELILQSRPLEPMDVALPNEAQSANNEALFLDESRIEESKSGVETLTTQVEAFIGTLESLLAETELNRVQIIDEIDKHGDDYLVLLNELAKYGLPQTGMGFIYERKKVLYKAVMEKVDELTLRWETKLAEFEALITGYDNLPPATTDEERMKLLFQAEGKIYSKTSTQTQPAAFRLELDTKKANFEAKLNTFTDIQTANHATLSGLVQVVNAALPISDFDVTAFEIGSQEDQVIVFTGELASHGQSLKADLEKRLAKAQELLDEALPLSPGRKRVGLLQDAAKQLFGADFKLISEFEMAEDQSSEWANAYNNSAQLLNHLVNNQKVEFPLDEWMYGLSRVRDKVRAWENMVGLAEAFTGAGPELHPVQLPHDADDSWMALAYPETQSTDRDKLLYTAHYASPFDNGRRQCGLLLDEWLEVIPSKTEDVGVTFHYDRPNSEPPQVMLLAMPSAFTGSWQWNDLMDTINDTLNQAKKRAIEPGHVDRTRYSRFLPATVSPVTVHPISASLNYAFNNQVYKSFEF